METELYFRKVKSAAKYGKQTKLRTKTDCKASTPFDKSVMKMVATANCTNKGVSGIMVGSGCVPAGAARGMWKPVNAIKSPPNDFLTNQNKKTKQENKTRC